MSVEKVLQRKLTCTFIKLTFDIWRHIWKCTVETSQIIAANVSMHPLMQVLWGHIWKRTVEKSPTNATNVTLPLLVETFWGHIWQRTVEKNQTNATNVTNECILQWNKCNQYNYTTHTVWVYISKYTQMSKFSSKHQEKVIVFAAQVHVEFYFPKLGKTFSKLQNIFSFKSNKNCNTFMLFWLCGSVARAETLQLCHLTRMGERGEG